ncbi:MAG: flagellin [Alphaproteobacteria bacterium]|nr:flagellin [Alphaproteobacteria bacterium]
MSEVTLTAGMRSTLLLLQNTQVSFDRTQNRLATGNKINSALDGPQAFFAAKGLTQRAGDLSALKDAMGQAISTVKAADKAITSIEKLVEQARGLTTTALQNLGNDAASVASRRALAQQYDGILAQVNQLVGDAGYQGKNLLAGDGVSFDATSTSKADVLADADLASITAIAVSNANTDADYQIAITGDAAVTGKAEDLAKAEQKLGVVNLVVGGTLSGTAGSFDDFQVEIEGGAGQTKTLTVRQGDRTFSATLDDTNNLTQVAATGFTATLTDGTATTAGTVALVSDDGSTIDFDLEFDAVEAAFNGATKVSADIEKLTNITVSVTNTDTGETVSRAADNLQGAGKLANGENAFAFGGATIRLTLSEALIAADAGGTPTDDTISVIQVGEQSDANNLRVQFNERNTSALIVSSENAGTGGTGLRLDNATNAWRDRTDIERAVTAIDGARSALRSVASGLSANLNIIQTRESFTQEFTDVLTEGAGKLTLADQNEEGANLLALQTRQQLGTISLSLANQAQQGILRLF